MNYVIDFQETGEINPELTGGKGANLGELSRINGISVPEGFCISTEVYRELIGKNKAIQALINQLNQLQAAERKAIAETGRQIRTAIENLEIPKAIDDAILRHLEPFGPETAFAVRSSATAEDLPSASFAGQQDSYLNIKGTEEIRKHVLKCLASLFTERAIVYRIQNGFDHQKVQLSVIVQRLIFPQASGVLFTADPLSSNRTIVSIDAGFGLGEALVSGLVKPDLYRVFQNETIEKHVAEKKIAVQPSKSGGTVTRELETEKQHQQVLTDRQILELAAIGRKIEAHFGSPQDIEWCLAAEQFFIVQSRPITTLFPVPEAHDDQRHVYVSVGHQQMMTDAMKPLGISIWQLSTFHPMQTAGGRLFLDISKQLSTPGGRETLLNTLGKSDPLSKDALLDIMERHYIPEAAEDPNTPSPANTKNLLSRDSPGPDPAVVTELIRRNLESIRELREHLRTKSGTELIDFITADLQVLKSILFDPHSFSALMAGLNASAWLNEKMLEWLGEKNAADTLSQSLDNNVTSEMGLALMDVADRIRRYPQIVAFLEQANDASFLSKLPVFEGGEEILQAITEYLDKYGMRCAGEIDITKTRWSENPAILIPVIRNNIRHFEPGAGSRKFEQGRAEALEKERTLLRRLEKLPDGAQKAAAAKQQIDQLRNFSGYREFPKYVMISRYFAYKEALMREAEKLAQSGVIPHKEDIFYLTFGELEEVVRTRQADLRLIQKRKEEFKIHEKLTPPRLLTSDGEIITGKYRREDLPEHALAGLAVSTGIIEGRARVILNMEDAVLEAGDILVTTFTDPSWTPLFVSIKGLVTEVGGLMTHGAVIAREYGIPAVVGVEHAVQRIKDGDRIRVNGSEGWVEILEKKH